MAEQLNKLAAKTVEALATKGRHSDGGGLYLKVLEDGRRQWVFMFRWQGKPKEMGLGAFAPVDVPKGVKLDIVSLADARQKAADARAVLASGVNPIEARRSVVVVPTFGKLADEVIDLLAGKRFKNDKHIKQWRTTLGDEYCKVLRRKLVNGITRADIETTLRPIWERTPETARRLCNRIEYVLAVAIDREYRQSNNPAKWHNGMSIRFVSEKKAETRHHAALHYTDIPAFVAALRKRPGMVSLALEFAVLTASRSGRVYEAKWSEMDLTTKTWTIPAELMRKTNREHTVPLCDRAIEILEAAKALAVLPGEYVFPGRKRGHPLSDRSMLLAVKRAGYGVTVHGFRSTFRDWCGDETETPREVAEAALSHTVGNKVEQAYRRGTALERRRVLMTAWEAYCNGDQTATAADQDDEATASNAV
ncbi:site-specific integrase [Rhizobium sp. 18055]|uniref:tyrosine-type recombinase/integrase n=1 Tax=Rhizobium sp. 18055 TaxID=2681403 RepID=UPI001FCE6C04|nr:site-specific integrase [Rhizobium sp. 18055]